MKAKVTAVVTLLVAGLGFLIISSSSEATHPHYQLHEFKQVLETGHEKVDGKYMTIYGLVKEGSIKKKGIQAEFIIEKNGYELPVFFTGKTLLPDAFKDGSEATVDGTYDHAQKKLIADKVMAKCASKYAPAGMPQKEL